MYSGMLGNGHLMRLGLSLSFLLAEQIAGNMITDVEQATWALSTDEAANSHRSLATTPTEAPTLYPTNAQQGNSKHTTKNKKNKNNNKQNKQKNKNNIKKLKRNNKHKQKQTQQQQTKTKTKTTSTTTTNTKTKTKTKHTHQVAF